MSLDDPFDDNNYEALLPDGTRCQWDERLRTVGALRVPKEEDNEYDPPRDGVTH